MSKKTAKLQKIPIKIDPCPIDRAFFEVRFVSDVASEIPGMIYSRIREDYEKMPRSPVAQIPEELRDRDPNLRFLPTDNYQSESFVLGLGNHSANLSTHSFRYPGWSGFLPEIQNILEILLNAGILREVERFGLRYVNFFPNENVWPRLKLKVTLDGSSLPDGNLYLRNQIREKGLESMTQVGYPAYRSEGAAGQPGSGTVIDVDVSTQEVTLEASSGWHEIVKSLHDLEKRSFFALLSQEFLESLNPHYQD